MARFEERDVEIIVEIRARTDKAVLVHDGDTQVWLPLSQVDIVQDGAKTMVQLPEWLAMDKGLI